MVERVDFPVRGTMIHLFDETWQHHAEYLLRVNEAIKARWYRLGSRVEGAQASPRTEVTVRFYVTPDGFPEEAEILTATANERAQLVCRDAVLSAGPFGVWDAAMEERFGARAEMQITFLF